MLRSIRVGFKTGISCILALMVVGVLDSPGAFAQQRLNFYVGGFFPRGHQDTSGLITGREPDDVIQANSEFLTFNLKDFNTPSYGVEYLVGLGDRFEAGLGIGFQSRSVPSVYTFEINSNGNEIEQELRLRVIPATATIRFLPLGNDSVTPYIGAGVGVFNWRYSETGEFLATDRSIFRDSFIASGSQAGLVVLGGVRVPLGNWGIGGEVRYQKAKANLPADQEFFGSVIDLGGISGLFTVNVRF